MSATQRVKHLLTSHEVDHEIKQLDQSAHTAQQACEALGCTVSQIVKSLIFKTGDPAQPLLALISGEKRASLEKLSEIVGQKIVQADADFVKVQTGFTIGGVAPVGSINELPVYMDKSILMHEHVYAAAGHPNMIFRIDPNDLAKLSQAVIDDIAD